MDKAYLEKLKDPRWQKKRLEILQRDEWTCKICFDGESTLHVHHRYYTYGADPWDYPNEALVTLCHACHEGEGEESDAPKLLIRALAHKGVFNSQIINLALAIAESKANLGEPEWDVWLFHVERLLAAMDDPAKYRTLYNEYFAFLDAAQAKRKKPDGAG